METVNYCCIDLEVMVFLGQLLQTNPIHIVINKYK